jgi:hypothetical protein
MQLSDAALAITRWWRQDYYVYHGGEDEVVPMDVTHVRIHSSVRMIQKEAFHD